MALLVITTQLHCCFVEMLLMTWNNLHWWTICTDISIECMYFRICCSANSRL